jgi:hypothetical protein
VSDDGLVVTFTPTTPLLPSTVYWLSQGGLTDLAGNAIGGYPYTTTFTTEP